MEDKILEKTLDYLKNGRLTYWFRTPDPGNDESDDIWSDHPIFGHHKVEIRNRAEWYESPNVPTIYADHKHLFKNMDMSRPEETYFYQNVDSNDFRSKMETSAHLPSHQGEVILETRIRTKTPPSGENEFALVEYFARVYVEYEEIPGGITFAPRILARPLNRFFRWAFLKYVGKEMIEEDGNFARAKLQQYFQYLRKYHGEEPLQTKTRLQGAEDIPENQRFFE